MPLTPIPFVPWAGGIRISGCMVALGCSLHAIHDGGDHWIVVGQVRSVWQAEEDATPLLFFRGRYARLDGTREGGHGGAARRG